LGVFSFKRNLITQQKYFTLKSLWFLAKFTGNLRNLKCVFHFKEPLVFVEIHRKNKKFLNVNFGFPMGLFLETKFEHFL